MEEPDKVIAMTRLASVPPVYAIKRGTSILTFGLIVTEAFKLSLIINPPTKVEGQEEGYKGATVIDPLRGLHTDPVAVLDFEALYPSIMRAFNICVSTFIKSYNTTEGVPSEYAFPDYSVIKIDGGFTAVFKRTGIEGVFPSILRVLLEHRETVKNQMKSLKAGTIAYNQANAKQLCLKIASNSMYGFLGSPVSQLYERALAASVTSVGRESLFRVRTTIQELCKEGKIFPDVHVMYGDSVTGNTPLLIRERGRISICCIEELSGNWEAYHGTTEAFIPSPVVMQCLVHLMIQVSVLQERRLAAMKERPTDLLRRLLQGVQHLPVHRGVDVVDNVVRNLISKRHRLIPNDVAIRIDPRKVRGKRDQFHRQLHEIHLGAFQNRFLRNQREFPVLHHGPELGTRRDLLLAT